MITQINKFLNEKQPNKKMELKNAIKTNNSELYSKIMQHSTLKIANKVYFYSTTKNKYILA